MAELLAEGIGIFELVERASEVEDQFLEGEICQLRITGPVEVPQELLDFIEQTGAEHGITWARKPEAEGKTLVLTLIKASPFIIALGAVLKFAVSQAIWVALAFLVSAFAFQFLRLKPEEALQTMNWLVIGVVGIIGLLLFQTVSSASANRGGYRGYLD